MKHILFSLLISICNLSVYCQDTTTVVEDNYRYKSTPTWRYIGSSSSNDKWYVRSQYEKKDYQGIRIWVKIISPTATYKKKVYKNSYQLQLTVIDCEGKRIKYADYAIYDSNGKAIHSDSDEYKGFDAIIPDSMAEAVHTWVCLSFNN